MRSTSAFPLVLLLALATSSVCVPIPTSVDEECIYYASCGPYHQRHSKQSKAALPLQEPHFPAHHPESSKHVDTVEVRILEHHIAIPALQIQAQVPLKHPALDPVPEAAHDQEASAVNRPHQIHHKQGSSKPTDAELSVLHTQSQSPMGPEGKKYSFTASMMKKVQRVAGMRGRKCGMTGKASYGNHKHQDGKTTITYTYGYSYIRTDYTSVLVVSIVVIFLLAVVLVELLDKVIETTKALFGLDQGAIRLEDVDCDRSNPYPPFPHSPKAVQLMPAPPPRYTRLNLLPNLAQLESIAEEKKDSGP